MRRPKVAKGAWILKVTAPGWWFGDKMIQGLASGMASQVELNMQESVALRTVLSELTHNGIEHGNGGSEILPLTVKASWDGILLQVSVEDQGHGFGGHSVHPHDDHGRGIALAEGLLGGQLVYEKHGRRAVFWLPVKK